MDPAAALEQNQPDCIKCQSKGSARCGRCGASYCGAACQKEDWPVHKSVCKKRVEPAASGDGLRSKTFEATRVIGFQPELKRAVHVNDESIEACKAELVKNFKITDKELLSVRTKLDPAARRVAQTGYDKSLDGKRDMPILESNLKQFSNSMDARNTAVCLVAGADPNFQIGSICPSHGVREHHRILHTIRPFHTTEILSMMLRSGAYVDGGNLTHCEPPLFGAVAGGNLAAVKLYVEAGANLRAISANGTTVLHVCLMRDYVTGMKQYYEPLMISMCSNKIVMAWIKTQLNDTQKIRMEIFRYIMSFEQTKSIVNVVDEMGFSAATSAACSEADNPEMMQLLLDAGADLRLPSYKGQTPLSLAHTFQHLRTIAFLEAHFKGDPAYIAEQRSAGITTRMNFARGFKG